MYWTPSEGRDPCISLNQRAKKLTASSKLRLNHDVALQKRQQSRSSRRGQGAAEGSRGQRCPHLVLLLEAVALGTLHLGDVLKQVGHPDGRVQLGCLVGDRLSLRLPLLVVRLDQTAGLTGHGVAVV